MKHRAFTLIELLIVVAIIGILAAIAIPNFQNARIRANIAKVHAELRTLTIACEGYKIDNRVYPVGLIDGGAYSMGEWVLGALTTPLAYLSPGEDFFDPFTQSEQWYYNYWPLRQYENAENMFTPDGIVFESVGPDGMGGQGLDRILHRMWSSRRYGYSRISVQEALSYVNGERAYVYRSTNGLRSIGDIGRVAGETFGLPTQIGG